MTKQELLQNPIVMEIANEFASKMFVDETVTDWAQYRRLQNTVQSPLLFTEDQYRIYDGDVVVIKKGAVKNTITANKYNTNLHRNNGWKFYSQTKTK